MKAVPSYVTIVMFTADADRRHERVGGDHARPGQVHRHRRAGNVARGDVGRLGRLGDHRDRNQPARPPPAGRPCAWRARTSTSRPARARPACARAGVNPAIGIGNRAMLTELDAWAVRSPASPRRLIGTATRSSSTTSAVATVVGVQAGRDRGHEAVVDAEALLLGRVAQARERQGEGGEAIGGAASRPSPATSGHREPPCIRPIELTVFQARPHVAVVSVTVPLAKSSAPRTVAKARSVPRRRLSARLA